MGDGQVKDSNRDVPGRDVRGVPSPLRFPDETYTVEQFAQRVDVGPETMDSIRRLNEAGPLPTNPAARKEVPIATGVFDYFPDALVAIARLSMKANARHNPGEPLHWSKGKSNDHDDAALRHFLDRGKMDAEWGESHTVEYAWRALARLQTEIEADRAGMSYVAYVAKLKAGK